MATETPTLFAQLTGEDGPADKRVIKQVSVIDADGHAIDVAGGSYTLPEATADEIGGVLKGANVANTASDADNAAVRTAFNALLTSLRAAGVIG